MPKPKELTLDEIRAMKPGTETYELINKKWDQIAPLLEKEKLPDPAWMPSPAEPAEGDEGDAA